MLKQTLLGGGAVHGRLLYGIRVYPTGVGAAEGCDLLILIFGNLMDAKKAKSKDRSLRQLLHGLRAPGKLKTQETESKNPPLGRVGCCSRELARQIRNGGNNAWLAAQYGGSHGWKLAGR
jgi:hypothetical protein